ncbi:hypothetical protein [Amycolatopsis sp.]|uniref:hypothetical protein n=1 Tax=Amycolatopsis sp. TaxID=37632 RepID=UPI003457E0F5
MLAGGATNRDFAWGLVLGEETVVTHLSRMLRKLAVRTRGCRREDPRARSSSGTAGSGVMSYVPAGGTAWRGFVAAGLAGADAGVQVRGGRGRGHRQPVDDRPYGAGHVDPRPLCLRGVAAGPPTEAGSAAKFVEQRFAFGVRLGGACRVA